MSGLLLSVAVVFTFCSCGEDSDSVSESAPEPASEQGGYFINMEEARLLALKKAQVLDVRKPARFMRAHIPGAIRVDWTSFTLGEKSGVLLPHQQLMSRVAELNLDAARPILVVGDFNEGWGEEGRIAWLLRGCGLDDVFILRGGYRRWERFGGAVSAGLSVPLRGGFKPDADLSGDIVRADVATAKGALILDVRSESEFGGATPYGSRRGGHLEGAVNYPFECLFAKEQFLTPEELRDEPQFRGVESDRLIITYCTGGIRSAFVACALQDAGFTNVLNYSGSWWEESSH